ncbi:MAG TPA: Fe-S cluster assembly protein SufE [Gammaproteobacteria bacterium]|jgi:cysteine desulfuration protein SufE|nr:SufE family protein [Pseudomonadota bacterium]HAY44862.1 Fe-S cluster assembly protein SufE [Gammaproteobacteria bacterium]
MNPVAQAQQDTVEEFQLFEDWMARYEHIIDLGKALPDFPVEWRTEENRIRGCQSQVWFQIEMQKSGQMNIQGISDAAIVSGLIAILLRVYNDQKPNDILDAGPEFISDIGFDEHLSPTRSNGLHAMLKVIYEQAAVNMANSKPA